MEKGILEIYFLSILTKSVKIGKLVQARRAHNTIVVDDKFLTVGGWEGSVTELCQFNENEEIECSKQDPNLANWTRYPELFLVEENFCT